MKGAESKMREVSGRTMLANQVPCKDKLLELLQKHYGHSSFRQGQLEVIQSVLEGKDTLYIQSTGGGKSLCYQLPSLLLRGITVVVSPLISLMEDQVREAKLAGRRDVVALHGGLSWEQRREVLGRLHQIRVLLTSPEGLQSETVQQLLRTRGVALLVVDEAHCISQWGHDFRLDYLQIRQIRTQLGEPVCLALTATATQEVKQDIITFLRLEHVQLFEYSMDRPNIKLHVEQVNSQQEKLELLLKLVQARQDAGMIYCATRAKTEELTNRLTEAGVQGVAFYHGGLSAEERFIIQQQFLEGHLRIICATNAFGMGVNKPNIRYVIHYHFPSQLEAYVQEMGRCSRDGKRGLSYVLAQAGDEQIPYHFIEAESLTKEQTLALVQLLQTYQEQQLQWEKGDLLTHFLCSEQALDVALHHWGQVSKELSVEQQAEQVYSQIEQLKARKRKKMGRMLHWLELGAEGCRREAILHYFGQNLQEPGHPCCDLCTARLERIAVVDDLKQDIGDNMTGKSDKTVVLQSEREQSLYVDVDQHSQTLPFRQQQQVHIWQDKLHRLWPITENGEVNDGYERAIKPTS